MDELNKLKISELKTICEHYNLPVSRNRKELIDNIKYLLIDKHNMENRKDKIKTGKKKRVIVKDEVIKIPSKRYTNSPSRDNKDKKKTPSNTRITSTQNTRNTSTQSTASRYTKIGTLGNKGKEATTYLVKDSEGKKYAMKTYRKNKSSKKIIEEFQFQKTCYENGISPKVYSYDIDEKYIIMDILDYDLVDIIKYYKGKLPVKIQKEIIYIFEKLDKLGIFHGDPNPLNIMFRKEQTSTKEEFVPYIIDFGFSEKFSIKLISKYNKINGEKKKLGINDSNSNPINMYYMPVGLLLYLKKPFPDYRYSYIEKYVDESVIDKLDKM